VKFATNATCLPSGDHTGDDSVAPAGAPITFCAPVRGLTSVRAVVVLCVSSRDRLAMVSTSSPPR
jgi:hypothetical protein